jgi:CRP-like cAMP-binding protein
MAKNTIGELKELAQKQSAQGKRAQAAKSFLAVGDLEPTNPRWPQKAGEEYRALGEKSQAIGCFQKAAKLNAQQGFTLKAITLCKLILDLDRSNHEAQKMLASFSTSAAAEAAPPAPAPELVPEPPPFAPMELPEMPPPPDDLELIELPSPETDVAAPPLPEEPFAAAPPVPEIEIPPPEAPLFSVPPGETLGALELGRTMQVSGQALEQDMEAFEILLDEPAVAPAAVPKPTDKAAIVTRMPPTPIFSSLDQAALRALVERVAVRTYEPGARLITQGETGDSLFVLVEGEVAVYREGTPRVELTRLAEGAFFGEIALVTKTPRTATVEAVRECVALEVSRDVFNELIRNHPDMVKVILRFLRERLVNGLVETHPLFAPFAGAERAQLVQRFSLIETPKGTVLTEEGAFANGMYIMLCGEAEARRGGASQARFTSGDLFGVESLLTGKPSLVTVTATTKCWILKMREDTFREVILTYSPVLATLSDMIAAEDRQSETVAAGGAFVQLGIPLF